MCYTVFYAVGCSIWVRIIKKLFFYFILDKYTSHCLIVHKALRCQMCQLVCCLNKVIGIYLHLYNNQDYFSFNLFLRLPEEWSAQHSRG